MTLYDFSDALERMKDGKEMVRLGWQSTPVSRRKMRVVIKDGAVITHFVNYTSDRGVFSMDDILATDWVDADG